MMEPISTIKLHALCLFNFSDHIIRAIDCKFGIILGVRDISSIEISNSFEILLDDSLNINFEYLLKKLEQFKIVHPQLLFLGIYQLTDEMTPDHNTFAMLEQIKNFKHHFNWNTDIPIAYIMANPNSLNIGDDNSTSKSFQGYIYPCEMPTTTIIVANQTELIASSTISKNLVYSSTSKTTTSQPVNLLLSKDISTSVNLLYTKIKNVVDYFDLKKIKSLPIQEQVEIENQITYLANKISYFMSNNSYKSNSYLHKLQVSQLALLSDQVLALTNLNNDLNNKLIRMSSRQWTSKLTY